METSQNTGELYKALFEVIQKIETLKKDSKGYGYNYLSLEYLISYLKPILKAHGLFYVQMVGKVNDGNIGLVTRLMHKSGQWIDQEASIPLTDMKGVNKSQAAGAAITYLRRYSLASLFGIAENDTDGLTAEELKSRPIDPDLDSKLVKAWAHYREKGDTTAANYISECRAGKHPEKVDEVLKKYQASLTAKVFDGEKKLGEVING